MASSSFETTFALRFAERWKEPPRATWALLAPLAAFFGLSLFLEHRLNFAAVLLFGAKINAAISAGEHWRLLSDAFLHANFLHLFVNAYALLILGTLTERVMGWPRLVILFVLAAIVGSLCSWRFVESPSLGASGAIFGLLGGVTVFGIRYGRYLPMELRPLFGRSMILSLLLNAAIGLTFYRYIDNYAHAGGLLTGASLTLLLGDEVASPRRFKPLVGGLLAGVFLAVLYTWWKMFQNFFLLWFLGSARGTG